MKGSTTEGDRVEYAGARTKARQARMRAAFALVIVAACKQAHDPPAGSAILAQSRELAAKMCACKDAACAQPLREQWNALTKSLPGAEFTAEQVEGLAAEDQRFVACWSALAPQAK
ncbi:MAG TPA: hypothetical protein VM513_02260 [Kofleriaceae bacterium]|jgi:hypothetical protein|nr:hypothetical protein [Kofleriaceae bacterium]